MYVWFQVSFNGDFERSPPNISVASISWSVEQHNLGYEAEQEAECKERIYYNESLSSLNEPKDIEDIKKEYECPVCLNVMLPPVNIYQCSSGHCVCAKCQGEGVKFCPTCRNPIVGRAHNMENIAQLLFKSA